MLKPDEIFYTEYGSGPPLVLLHGLMVSGDMFDVLKEPLGTRYRLIMPDLRGHSRSRNLPPPYTIQQLAQDVSDLMDRLYIPSAAILGYSQGGAVAQALALDHPEKVSRLILVCTFAHNDVSFWEKLEARLAPVFMSLLGLRILARIVVSAVAKDLIKKDAEWLRNEMAGQDKRRMIRAWKELVAFDSSARLGEIHCPTLVIAGSKDRAVPAGHGKALHDGIDGSQFILIAGGGHMLIWSHTEQFVTEIERWLTG